MIAFQSNRSNLSEIDTIRSDGTGRRQLTKGSGIWPSFSRQSRIAFASARDGNLEIYSMDADGTNQKRLTNHPAADTYPDWSPDGSQIVFASDRSGNSDLFVMNADGSGVRQLTFTNGFVEEDPAWSPDGREIAFFRFSGGRELQKYEIGVMSSNGADYRGVGVGTAGPAWSPDGSRIAAPGLGPFGVYFRARDGSQLRPGLVRVSTAAKPAATSRRLVGTVGPGARISLKISGKKVLSLRAGRYGIVVNDLTSRHNFHLVGAGVNLSTGGPANRGRVRWSDNFVKGRYRYFSDASPRKLRGSFVVK